MKVSYWATVFSLALAGTPAAACNSEMLAVLEWQAIPNGGNPFFPYLLEAQIRYDGERPYRMIHAGVMFADALGAGLGQVNLTKDRPVAPGETVTADRQVQVDERIGTINPDDVRTRTCVWSVVYDDGTVQEFD